MNCRDLVTPLIIILFKRLECIISCFTKVQDDVAISSVFQRSNLSSDEKDKGAFAIIDRLTTSRHTKSTRTRDSEKRLGRSTSSYECRTAILRD